MAAPHARVPKLPKPLGQITFQSFKLTPTDGFVLSRIDNTSSEHDIALSTGLTEADVRESIYKLAKLGIVSVPRETVPPAATIAEPPKSLAEPPPAEADGEVTDLEPENRKLVNDLFRKLDGATHYELLGVPPDADKKRIKRAYYELAAHVHTDRFFRKNLGSYKAKMEAIFARVTLAHDVLTSKEKRPEYDSYLGARASARRIESMSDLKAVRIANSPSIEAPSASDPIPVSPIPAPKMVDLRERREVLARRLAGGSRRPAVAISNAPPSGPTSSGPPPPSKDPDALKRLFEERLGQARTVQARKHVEAGDDAVARSDFLAAATSYRTALSFVPDDPEASRKLAEVNDAAAAALADAYRKQAVYEEKNVQWVEASRSWSRLAKLAPNDLDAQDSAAKALVQASGDLHEAAMFAQRAANANPDCGRYRKTLGTVYLAAGLKKNARRELEAAARILPDDDTIQDLLKRAL
ncbi:MAG: J domain-containing protein [Polyangiaceae bacterium]